MIFTELEKKISDFIEKASKMLNICLSCALGFLPIARQLQKLRAYRYKRCMQAFSLSGHAGRCPQLGVILHLSRKMMATKMIKKRKSLASINCNDDFF